MNKKRKKSNSSDVSASENNLEPLVNEVISEVNKAMQGAVYGAQDGSLAEMEMITQTQTVMQIVNKQMVNIQGR